MTLMRVRKDLIEQGLSVPVGKGYYGDVAPLKVRWLREGENNEQFQVMLNGKWMNAESIDFE
jgi:hypothetical protein